MGYSTYAVLQPTKEGLFMTTTAGNYGGGFSLIVVLFILLIIIGTAYVY